MTDRVLAVLEVCPAVAVLPIGLANVKRVAECPRPGRPIYGVRRARLAVGFLQLLEIGCRALENFPDLLQPSLVVDVL
jgi:hypothetical protein